MGGTFYCITHTIAINLAELKISRVMKRILCLLRTFIFSCTSIKQTKISAANDCVR